MNNEDILREIETILRRPETDRKFLAGQLVVLASIIALDDENETGLIRGALGGLQYTIDRLREIWRQPDSDIKSLDALKDIFAGVELKRFARTTKEIEATKASLKEANLLFDLRRLEVSNGDTYYVFSSKIDQTTIDGRKILKNEIIDQASAPVPSFPLVYEKLLQQQRK